jgi:hypothetical protein
LIIKEVFEEGSLLDKGVCFGLLILFVDGINRGIIGSVL